MGATIEAQFMVNVSLKGYTDVYLEVIVGDKTYIYDKTLMEPYYVYGHGVAAKNMGVEMELTVYGTKDGVKYRGETVTWSVKTGIMDMLAHYYPLRNNSEKDMATTVLLVDMLYYGAAAQTQFNNTANGLVTDGLAEEYAVLRTQETPAMEKVNTPTKNAVGEMFSFALGIENAVYPQFGFRLPDDNYSQYTVKVTYGGKVYTYDAEDFTILTKGYIAVIFMEVNAKNMRDEFTVELYQGETQLSQTYTCSIEGGAKVMSAKPEYVAILEAMMKYGDSAALYMKLSGK
jgi:hypothetical protein